MPEEWYPVDLGTPLGRPEKNRRLSFWKVEEPPRGYRIERGPFAPSSKTFYCTHILSRVGAHASCEGPPEVQRLDAHHKLRNGQFGEGGYIYEWI